MHKVLAPYTLYISAAVKKTALLTTGISEYLYITIFDICIVLVCICAGCCIVLHFFVYVAPWSFSNAVSFYFYGAEMTISPHRLESLKIYPPWSKYFPVNLNPSLISMIIPSKSRIACKPQLYGNRKAAWVKMQVKNAV